MNTPGAAMVARAMLRLMPSPYDPAAWQNFYVMMGGANAALAGLVFVALSIHLKEVLAHPLLKPRAVIALTVLTTQIVIAAIVLTPQTSTWMGIEIFILNASFLAVDLRNRRSFSISAASLLTLAIRFLYIYSAISLLLGVGGGFYVLDFVIVITLGRTMISAWTLLTALE